MWLLRLGLVPCLLLTFLMGQGCHSRDVPIAKDLQPRSYDSNGSLIQTSNPANATISSLRPLATGNRPVYLVMQVRMIASQTFPPTYEKLFPVYGSLHFNATSTEGPLEIQLVNQNGQDLIRVTDWGLENADKPLGVPQPGYLTDFFELFGKSNLTNDQILNSSTGEGLIHDVWSRNSSLALKAYNSVDFMHACIAQLGLGLAPSDNPLAIIPSRIALAQTYWRNLWVAEKVISDFPVWLETLNGWGSEVKKTRAEFKWHNGSDPSSGMIQTRPVSIDQSTLGSGDGLVDDGISDLAAPEVTETYLASNETLQTAPQFQLIYAQPNNTRKVQRRASTVMDQYIVENPGESYAIGTRLEDGGNALAMEEASGSSTNGEASGQDASTMREWEASREDTVFEVNPPENQITDAVVARIAARPYLTFVRAMGGIGATAGSVAIIVIDFKVSHAQNAELCAILSIILLGAGLFLYLATPGIGEIFMLTSVLVGEIPNYTNGAEKPGNSPAHSDYRNDRNNFGGHGKRAPSVPTPPMRTDVQGILQYTIVGDRNQTGNEKCVSKGYKKCTTVYGPYLLASALQIEPFDPFALLIHANNGYPLSMQDLIKAFSLSTDPDSANQVATIDCSHSTKPNDRYSWSNPNTATILHECDKPSFSINRKLINLPILDQTADIIYDRLMPQGNCSLVGDVTGGEKYAAYNLTITGGAVAIACGIVGAINVNETASPLPGAPTNQSTPLSLVNNGNQSSDGSSGRAYLAPPSMTPFESTLNLTNSLCMGGSDGSKLCFPNGTYASQDGGLGFDSTKANTLMLGVNSSIVITESARARSKAIYAHAPAPLPSYVDHKVKYTTNQSATDTGFAGDMQNMIKYIKDNTFTVNVPAEPDAACFYQQPLGLGDFACFGPGGGDLPPGLKGKTKSVKAYGRASVEMFANSYGNSFAHIIDTYEEDLSQLPYDKQSSFADVASSIWVYLEPGAEMPTMGGPQKGNPSGPGPAAATPRSQ